MTDTPLKKTYWARTGDRAMCRQSREVARFAEPLLDGEQIDCDRHLTAWTLAEHQKNTGICACGSLFRSGYGTATKLFVAGEWIPGEQPKAEVKTEHVTLIGMLEDLWAGRME